MSDWAECELESAVRAYLRMLALQEGGISFSKTAIRRELRAGPLKDRSEPSIEFRMRNISAVMSEHGRATVRGYVGAANVGKTLRRRIWEIVRTCDGEADEEFAQLTSAPARKTARRPRPPIIYFNVGWMKRYQGIASDDPTIGGHAYFAKQKHTHGAEAFNFLPTRGATLQGYRPPGAAEKTDIGRLGAAPEEEHIDGVLVVWLAREPGTGRTRIIGWYENARVYRTAQPGSFTLEGSREHYTAEAAAASCRLLPPVARTFEVKSSRTAPGEGFGQKPTWYGTPKVDARVWNYISNYGKLPASAKPRKAKGRPPRNHDPELRRKVERAAVDHAVGYFKSVYGPMCRVESVESQAKGWDIEVFCGAEPLLVEVKGLLNQELVCELTPNEFANMMKEGNRSRYVVYVVNNALAAAPASPLPSVFEHCGGDVWRTRDGRELKITPKTGAVLTV